MISMTCQDTKLALMMTSNMLHERFHRSTGISFSSIYPGSSAISTQRTRWKTSGGEKPCLFLLSLEVSSMLLFGKAWKQIRMFHFYRMIGGHIASDKTLIEPSGCIAESPLFREKRPWFRLVAGGYGSH